MKLPSLTGVVFTAWFAWTGVAMGADSNPDRDDFATANDLAIASMKVVRERKFLLDDAVRIRTCQQEIIDKLQADFSEALNLAKPELDRAVLLATDADDKQEVRSARLRLAYANLWLRNFYETAVLAENVARSAGANDGTLAEDCAFLSFTSLQQAFQSSRSPVGQKSQDLHLMIKAYHQLADRWPDSNKLSEAAMILGLSHDQEQLPAEAVGWYEKVPPSHPSYAFAQIRAGQAWMNAYNNASRLPVAQKPTPAQFSAWLNAAHNHLRIGVDSMSKEVSNDSAARELVWTKFQLSQVTLSLGHDAEALKLLLDEPNILTAVVGISDGVDGSEKDIRSRRIALEFHVRRFRAYMGLGETELADETWSKSIAAFRDSEITEMLSGLDRDIKRLGENGEIENQQRLRKSFEALQKKLAPAGKSSPDAGTKHAK